MKVSFSFIFLGLPLLILLIGLPCFGFGFILFLDQLINLCPQLFSHTSLYFRMLRWSDLFLIVTLCFMDFNFNIFLWHSSYYTSNQLKSINMSLLNYLYNTFTLLNITHCYSNLEANFINTEKGLHKGLAIWSSRRPQMGREGG